MFGTLTEHYCVKVCKLRLSAEEALIVMMPHIISAHVERSFLPLKRPYAPSFGTIDVFDTLLLYVTLDNGENRIGEVVPLPGYSSESPENVLHTVESWLPHLLGQNLQNARQSIASQIAAAPCASSLILSTLDAGLMAENKHKKLRHCVPLVYPTSSADPDIEQTVKQAISLGYKTIKVKIGANLEQDLAALPKLGMALLPEIRVRFDANQAYTGEEAQCFLSAVEAQLSESTELVEQPLPTDAWNEIASLSDKTTIPLMLDESISNLDDVTRAAEVGCKWIKLKLCKQGGVHELLQLATHATSIGLKVVIGNGVATDVSNQLELWVYDNYRNLFAGASESNGFAKLREPITYKMLNVELGCAVW
jgi:L-Ala-D/L-Glu epimerase